jgi:hypothetical protein
MFNTVYNGEMFNDVQNEVNWRNLSMDLILGPKKEKQSSALICFTCNQKQDVSGCRH